MGARGRPHALRGEAAWKPSRAGVRGGPGGRPAPRGLAAASAGQGVQLFLAAWMGANGRRPRRAVSTESIASHLCFVKAGNSCKKGDSRPCFVRI